jgi:hypothetical protein
MKRSLPLISACVLLFGLMVSAQTKPDFAGTWKLAADAAAGDDMFTASELAAVQDAATLTVTSTTSQMGPLKTIYKLDGSDGQSPLDFNGTTVARTTKAAWDGTKLVLTTTSDFNGQSIEFKQVWSLGADGSLLVESTRPDFQGGGAAVTTKATYKKS